MFMEEWEGELQELLPQILCFTVVSEVHCKYQGLCLVQDEKVQRWRKASGWYAWEKDGGAEGDRDSWAWGRNAEIEELGLLSIIFHSQERSCQSEYLF